MMVKTGPKDLPFQASRSCWRLHGGRILANGPRLFGNQFFSACATTRTDVESLFWRRESLGWLKTQSHRHELFISAEVVAELSQPSYPRSQEALAFIAGIPLLEITAEVLGLARLFVDEKAMPGPLEGDAVHVAAATYHRLDYLLTWNVKHLANPNKRMPLSKLCMRVGLAPPEIVTPSNLWEAENEFD